MAKKEPGCPDCTAGLTVKHLPDGGVLVKCENDCGFSNHIPAEQANMFTMIEKAFREHRSNELSSRHKVAKQKTLCPDCKDSFLMSVHLPDGRMLVKCEADCGCVKVINADKVSEARKFIEERMRPLTEAVILN
ncbi:hypothetical protein KAR91_01355 [Candidatus Pacearchaeota archaeon]|nr:hypothetical protein [Candidatus Pacearchaeota archaeon]